jgi:hypothetical protein
VIDGVFSAANTGTVDAVYGYGMLSMIRDSLDKQLVAKAKSTVPDTLWTPDQGMTGMLIRSELVRRWPDMLVGASTPQGSIPVLRREPISKDLLIALFGGEPTLVTVSEPFKGMRFGVEPKIDDPSKYTAGKRDPNGGGEDRIDVPMRGRVIAVRQLSAQLKPDVVAGPGGVRLLSPRMMALALEEKPFKQQFQSGQPELSGSASLDTPPPKMRGGRVMNLSNLVARAKLAAELEKS